MHILKSEKLGVGVMCGKRWYRFESWRMYPVIWRTKSRNAVGIGPILFWKKL